MSTTNRPAETNNARRAFVRSETNALGRFLGDSDGTLVGWDRTYRCECGFVCHSAQEIFDHVNSKAVS